MHFSARNPISAFVCGNAQRASGYSRFFDDRRTARFFLAFFALDFLVDFRGLLLRNFTSANFFVVLETASPAAAPVFVRTSAAESTTAFIPTLAA